MVYFKMNTKLEYVIINVTKSISFYIFFLVLRSEG